VIDLSRATNCRLKRERERVATRLREIEDEIDRRMENETLNRKINEAAG
jgi:hypothetical protein